MIDEKMQLLEMDGQSENDRLQIRTALALALDIFACASRDQGTPYIDHPLAVAKILIRELSINDGHLIVIALLHDALEVNPASQSRLQKTLGEKVFNSIWSMTKEHRAFNRPRSAEDELMYRNKIASLPPDLLIVKLADRLHNLRELPQSSKMERIEPYLRSLTEFYLPLARQRAGQTQTVKDIYKLLLIALEDTCTTLTKKSPGRYELYAVFAKDALQEFESSS